jgi:hypothetical protein
MSMHKQEDYGWLTRTQVDSGLSSSALEAMFPSQLPDAFSSGVLWIQRVGTPTFDVRVEPAPFLVGEFFGDQNYRVASVSAGGTTLTHVYRVDTADVDGENHADIFAAPSGGVSHSFFVRSTADPTLFTENQGGPYTSLDAALKVALERAKVLYPHVAVPGPRPVATDKKTYHIRYNTHHATSEHPELVWRVFEDGVEHLVEELNICSPVFGQKTTEFGVTKYNICTLGFMSISNGAATITSEPQNAA